MSERSASDEKEVGSLVRARRVGERRERTLDVAFESGGKPPTPGQRSSLRHPFATRLLRQTKNLPLVQIACRHSSPAVTAIYTHPSMQERLVAADSFDW